MVIFSLLEQMAHKQSPLSSDNLEQFETLQILLQNGSDVSLLKKKLKVLTSFYVKLLEYISTEEVDEIVFSYVSDKIVSNVQLLGQTLKASSNLGFCVAILQCLKFVMLIHIKTRSLHRKRVNSICKGIYEICYHILKEYVALYADGHTFCLAMKILFTVSRNRNDMRKNLTETAKKYLQSPSPNLFDHNIRSYRNYLKKGLFMFLKSACDSEEQENLITLLGEVGVPRKYLAFWDPINLSSRKKCHDHENPHSNSKINLREIQFTPVIKTNNFAEYDTDSLKRIIYCATKNNSKASQSYSPPIRTNPYQRDPRFKLPMNYIPIIDTPSPINYPPISKTSYQYNQRVPSPLNIARGIASQEKFQEPKRIDFNAISITTSEVKNIRETLEKIFPGLPNQYKTSTSVQ